MKLSSAAKALQTTFVGDDLEFHGISIDSRTLKAGEVFLAIKGPNFNGHDFVNTAADAGAVATIVSEKVDTRLPTISVTNTYQALWDLAKAYRAQLRIPFFALTGSCGKTTTKTLLASILAQVGKVHASPGNYNNDLGVPLTILQIKPDCDYVVTELGANHCHEIEKLVALVQPEVALITLAAPVHLEGFGSLAGVARGKGEIYSGLTPNGTAIINADDQYADYWRGLIQSGQRIITFGIENNADVMAKNIRLDAKTRPEFDLVTPQGKVAIKLQLIGEHNVVNALAAATAAFAYGIPLVSIQAGLQQAVAVAKRLVERVGLKGETVIDDTYNANPLATQAAIKILTQRPGTTVLVLGDMLELGAEAETLHHDLGKMAAQSGVDRLFCLGELCRHAATGFGERGEHFASHDDLIKALQPHLGQNVTVLVKGSHSMHMDTITKALVGQ